MPHQDLIWDAGKYCFLRLFTLGFGMFIGISVSAQSHRIQIPDGSATPFEKQFEDALDSNADTLWIHQPEKPIITGPLELKNVHDKIVLFTDGTDLRAREGAFSKRNASLIKLYECREIGILGSDNVLEMRKPEYTDGEWRHVVEIRGSDHIRIANLTVSDSGGDGIYIAGSKSKRSSSSIRIENIKSIRNKRQGISIISARNVTVTNSLFSQTLGTFPGAGVDIEPNTPSDIISDIHFIDCIFEKNYHAGVILNLGKLNSQSVPVDIHFTNCVIRDNHATDNPKVATEILIRSAKSEPVSGQVIFKKCLIENSKWGMLYARKHADAFHVRFIDCTARNICNNPGVSAIGLEVLDYKNIHNDIGGFAFESLLLEYDSDQPIVTIRGSRRGTLKHVRDITGQITFLGEVAEEIKYINYNPKSNIQVALEFVRRHSKNE